MTQSIPYSRYKLIIRVVQIFLQTGRIVVFHEPRSRIILVFSVYLPHSNALSKRRSHLKLFSTKEVCIQLCLLIYFFLFYFAIHFSIDVILQYDFHYLKRVSVVKFVISFKRNFIIKLLNFIGLCPNRKFYHILIVF